MTRPTSSGKREISRVLRAARASGREIIGLCFPGFRGGSGHPGHSWQPVRERKNFQGDRAYPLQPPKDNVALFTVEVLDRFNQAVVGLGREPTGKRARRPLESCDPSVVETDARFPTDVNVLRGAIRKIMDALPGLGTARACRPQGRGRLDGPGRGRRRLASGGFPRMPQAVPRSLRRGSFPKSPRATNTPPSTPAARPFWPG